MTVKFEHESDDRKLSLEVRPNGECLLMGEHPADETVSLDAGELRWLVVAAGPGAIAALNALANTPVEEAPA